MQEDNFVIDVDAIDVDGIGNEDSAPFEEKNSGISVAKKSHIKCEPSLDSEECVEVDAAESDISSDLLSDNSGEEDGDDTVEKLFRVDKKRGVYPITKHLMKAVHAFVPGHLPIYPACSEGGTETVLDMSGWPEEHLSMDYILNCFPYNSQSKKTYLKVQMEFTGRMVDCYRTTRECSGIKVCETVPVELREAEHNNHESPSVEELKHSVRPHLTEEETIIYRSRQAWYYLKNLNFRCPCSAGSGTIGDLLTANGNTESNQIHCVVKEGRLDDSFSVMPPFVGCQRYRYQDGISHRLERLTNFKDIDIQLVNSWKSTGGPPEQTQAMREAERCLPEPLQGIGNVCKSPVHEFQKCKLLRIGCSVRYHFLIPRMRSGPSLRPTFAVIIGVGKHHHMRPLLKPNRDLVKRVTGEALRNNMFARTQHIIDMVVNEAGMPPRDSYVQHIMSSMRRDAHPFGPGIQAVRLIMKRTEEAIEKGEDLEKYIWHCNISDENDDASGVSIVFSHRELLRRTALSGVLAIDGAHGTAISDEDDRPVLELVNVVCQHQATGRTYSVAHQLSSRKTERSRYEFLVWLFQELKKEGLKSPFAPDSSHQRFLSLTTDFETTFLKSAGMACQTVWKYAGKTWSDNSRRLVSSCAFHRKNMILKKTGNNPSHEWYKLVDNATESLKTETQVKDLLDLFDTWSSTWKQFSNWLRSNVTALWLVFPTVYCTRDVVQDGSVAFHTNNQFETTNRRVKDDLDIIRKGRRTGDILTVIDVCKKLDHRDARNLKRYAMEVFRQQSGKPKWDVQGEQLRKRKRLEDAKRTAEFRSGKKPKKARTLTKPPKNALRKAQKSHSHDEDLLAAIKTIQYRMEQQETFQKQTMKMQRKTMELQKKELALHAREMDRVDERLGKVYRKKCETITRHRHLF